MSRNYGSFWLTQFTSLVINYQDNTTVNEDRFENQN